MKVPCASPALQRSRTAVQVPENRAGKNEPIVVTHHGKPYALIHARRRPGGLGGESLPERAARLGRRMPLRLSLSAAVVVVNVPSPARQIIAPALVVSTEDFHEALPMRSLPDQQPAALFQQARSGRSSARALEESRFAPSKHGAYLEPPGGGEEAHQESARHSPRR
jgi:hypothetical protein